MSLEAICNIIQKEYEKNINTNIDINNILSQEFINNLLNIYSIEKVIYCLKYLFDIEIIFDTELKYKSSIARDDNEYKKAVKNKFKKCIICDNCPEYTYQVAHIWNYKNCKNNIEDVFNINNGLLMCANSHLLFDNHILKLQVSNELYSATEFEVKIIIDKNKANEYNKYNNKSIFLNYENIKYIEKRYSNPENIL
jgi:hypothetical protein